MTKLMSKAISKVILLTWMICEMGDKWLYDCCFVVCCFQDLFKITCSIFVYFPSHFFSKHFVKVQGVLPSNSSDTGTVLKNSFFVRDQISLWSIFLMHIYWHLFDIAIWVSEMVYLYLIIENDSQGSCVF